jgi:indole-3-glycerol phosphate synthase
MSDVLARICSDKRKFVAARMAQVSLAEIQRRATAAPEPRGFHAALSRAHAPGRPALIAEIKKASPSRGLIRSEGFDPPALARAYRDGGAACLSVLTDEPYFQGRDADLVAARAAVDLPVLRKDFILEPYQVFEARALGADCILLIVAALDPTMLMELARLGRSLGMDVLVEVHDERELAAALKMDDVLLGINNRDLRTLKVDIATFERLAARAQGRFLVAESGLQNAADVARVARCGAGAILVGESLMAQSDVSAATRALLGTTQAAMA